MGIYLSQLPPAEVARLKAELAETLIANFCYPRFFDYRTNALRMRPIDRSKRQEVWLYLSAVDFTSWNRIDLLSPDFQHQVERLFIHFVQRNRNFFGEQGRKRMPDVRMLIASSAAAVTEGLRRHLTGRHAGNMPFGSPRPVISWSTLNATDRPEPGWEQISPATMLLQQQLQETRGEIKAAPPTTKEEQRPPSTPARRSGRARSTANGTGTRSNMTSEREQQTAKTATPSPAPQGEVKEVPSQSKPEAAESSTAATVEAAKSNPKVVEPLAPMAETTKSKPKATGPLAAPTETPMPQTAPIAAVSPRQKSEPVEIAGDMPVASTVLPDKSTVPAIVQPAQHAPEQAHPPKPVQPQQPQQPQQTQHPQQLQHHAVVPVLPHAQDIPPAMQKPTAGVPATTTSSAAMLISDEDIVIFEQLRYQLIVWLRVEAVRSGADISGQGPVQLLELLRQQESIDETRLQVVSTLLNISNTVITSGRADLLDYKQAMMFYLMHTRR